MMLSPIVAQEVLRSALYDPAEALGGKAPKLWGMHNGTIYQFMYDNQGTWHGFPVMSKPPDHVLSAWRANETISNSDYKKILKYRNRGA